MAASDARPVPRKNTAFRYYFAIRKNDGTLITTWAGADSEVSLDGAAFSDCTNEATEIGTTGCGYIDFTSSEMNADCVVYKLTVTNTSALPIVVTLFPEESGDYRADVTMLGGDAQSATDLKDFADAGYDPATNKVQGVVLVDTLTTYTGNTVQTGDSYGIVNSGTHGNAAIKGYVEDIGTAGAGLTAIPWNASWDAEVQSEAEDAIVAHRLDELLNADSDIDGAAPPTVGSVFHELMSKTAGSFTYNQTTDSNEAIKDAIGTPASDLYTILGHIDGNTDLIVADTNELQTDWANGGRLDLILDARASQASVDDLPTVAEFEARTIAAANYSTASALASLVTTVGVAGAGLTAADDAVIAAIAALSIPTVAQIWTTALTESYRGTGATGTGAQLLYELLSNIVEFAIVSTTKTAKKLDGSTTAKTYTLDSATTPTSITEAT